MEPMYYPLIAIGVLFLLWVAAHMKTSRPDGTLVTDHHPYRRIMWYIMPTRNESVVYFDDYVDAEEILAYVEEANQKFGASMMDVIVTAVARGLVQNPAMDKFIAGHRMYQRKTPTLTFSMKRKRKDARSKIATVKEEFSPEDTVQTITERVSAKVNVERSSKKTYADKEFQLFNLLPRPFFRVAFRIFRLLDYYNLMPASFLKTDPMYTSIFVANLGSVGMGAGYHHLYEYGTASLFIMVGKIEEKAVVRDGEVVIRKVMHVRFSYDERIDDGMTASFGINDMHDCLSHPYEMLGCLGDDDHYSIGEERPRFWSPPGKAKKDAEKAA